MPSRGSLPSVCLSTQQVPCSQQVRRQVSQVSVLLHAPLQQAAAGQRAEEAVC